MPTMFRWPSFARYTSTKAPMTVIILRAVLAACRSIGRSLYGVPGSRPPARKYRRSMSAATPAIGKAAMARRM
jgi:hypothetical protein